MAITVAETRGHLFELVTAGLGAKSAPHADYSDLDEAMAVAIEASDLIGIHIAQIRDIRWTDEYANALEAGAALIVGGLLRHGEAEEWSTRALMAKIVGLT
jgi:hypothetical protein